MLIENQSFHDRLWQRQSFSGLSLDHCTFTDCKMEANSLEGCHFNECTFINCRIAENFFDACTARHALLRHCTVVSLDWSQLTKLKAHFSALLPFGTVESCTFAYCTFASLKLADMDFSQSTFKGCTFDACCLAGASFQKSALPDTLFIDNDMRRADFTGARDYALSPLSNRLEGAAFSLPEALSLLEAMDIRLI
nr:pentapeptide repeat-containing protein [bacterium]